MDYTRYQTLNITRRGVIPFSYQYELVLPCLGRYSTVCGFAPNPLVDQKME